MLESISLKDLPKTFQDAVHITRKLGYQYLWIDSLCIIQDSDKDWRKESSAMGDIYRNAECCISALAGQNSNAGCFRNRNPLLSFPCKIGRTDMQEFYVHLTEEHDWHWNCSFDKKTSPLRSRAWAFQENMLSQRTLNYASNMLFWDCCELQAWESKPDGSLDALRFGYGSSKHYLEGVQQAVAKAVANDKCPDALGQVRIIWGEIISGYTQCELTFETDKLVALSGIAERMQRCTGLSYVAGLWEESLLYYMFWQSKPRYSGYVQENCKRPLTYRAPSWSWASVEGNITWFHPGQSMKWTAKILHVEVVLVDHQSLFGQVSGGSLCVSGCLQKARYSGNRPSWRGHFFAGKGFEFPSRGDLTIYWDTKCPDVATIDEFIFLLLGIDEPEPANYTSYKGLVLEPSKVRSNCFQRVGWFSEYLQGAKLSSFPQESKAQEITII
jgi:hypothetical protein